MGSTVIEGRQVYDAVNRRRWLSISALLSLTTFFALIDVTTGVANIDITTVISALVSPENVDGMTRTIVWTMRLPVALTAVAVGASLGLAGAVMQTILGNPLASPYTLGVGAGAGFGASLAIVLSGAVLPSIGSLLIPTSAFIFAMVVCMSIYAIGRLGGMSTESMILSGIAMLFLFQALQALLQYYATEGDVQAIVFWTFGNLQKTTWGKFSLIVAVLVAVTPFIMADSWRYTALMLGDEKAESLGISVEPLKVKAFVLISLLSASAVCFVGTIGFIGLAGPHIARILSGDDQRFFLPMSSLCGAMIMALSSVISKSVVPGSVFPIGIITSIIGVPFFFVLIAYRQRSWR